MCSVYSILSIIHTVYIGPVLNSNGGNNGQGLRTLRVNRTLPHFPTTGKVGFSGTL